jgi:multidrug efflux pump subunit AcrA (membrane-fusion protein)
MSILSGLAGRTPQLAAPRIRLWNAILIAGLAGLAVAAYLVVHTSPPAASATPRTAPVSRGVVLSSVSASGSVATPTNLSVGFETSGRVASVDVKAGQRVSKGQVIGRLDQTDAKASLAAAQAALASAKANLLTAQTGESAAQRQADTVALAQSKAQVTQAKASLKAVQAQLTTDTRTTAQSITAAKSSLAVKQAQAQLNIDQGGERGAVAKQKADQAKLTVNGTSYASADAAVSAWTNTVNQDKSSVQTQTQANYDLQTQQTVDQQQLAADQSSQKAATTPADQSYWQAKVDQDQAAVNADTLRVQQQQKQLNELQYQLTQDESTLQAQQTLQTTLTQDASTITTLESRIVTDRNQIANAQAQRQNQIQTAESTRATTVAKDQQAVVQAQQQVKSGELAQQATTANNHVKAYVSPATLAQDRAQVVQADTNLASAERTLAQTVLRAPESGTVASVNGVAGQTVSGGGTSTTASTATASSSTGTTGGGATSSSTSSTGSSSAFAQLVDVQGLQVVAAFSETDAAKIRLGLPATVTVSALPTAELAAHVIATDVVGTSSSGVVEYNVTLALDRTVSGLKPGMSANASVTTSERDNALNVPNAAVTGSGASARVTVLTNGNEQTVDVVAGLKGDSATEIISGLKAGQQVVTSSGVAATSGASGATTTPGVGRGFGGGLGGGVGGGFGGGGGRGG